MAETTILTPRVRMRLALDHKEADRIPIQDSPWAATITRWQREGLPDGISAEEYFGFEMRSFGADLTPQYPIRVLQRSPEYIVETTPYGGVRKNHRDYSTTPELIDYGIKTREDWEAAKRRLRPGFTRVDWVTLHNNYERARSENFYLTFAAVTGYDLCQSYIRSDILLPLLITDPDWIRDIAETQADMVIETAKILMREGYTFDAAFLFNDMGYRNGPFFSPRMYRQLFQPADRRMFDFFHSHGMKVLLHSCGNVKMLIPDLLAIGLDCLQPLEVKAGMDLEALKREYGKDLAFMGGIDVRTMSDPDPAAAEREIAAKITAAKVGGGYIYHSDHSIPNDVSFDRYRRVLELVRKYGEY
jgi:uroporphyrinogen decarboxylase